MSPHQRWRIQTAAAHVPDLWAVDPYHAQEYVDGLWANATPAQRLYHQHKQVAQSASDILADLTARSST
jgi:hypothetical protein